MKTVIIDKKDIILKFDQNSIKLENRSIPYKHIDTLVLNHKQSLQTSDILRLTKNNISTLIVSAFNDHFSLIHSANAKNSHIKLAQFSYYPHSLEYAKYIIKHKLINHKLHLKRYDILLDISSQRDQITKATSTNELLGIEGSFAKEYFKHFFTLLPSSLHKNKRSKQPPLDPINATMSYWYHLYYYFITLQLLSYGFEPSIGYLHKPFRSHYALSSDLLELFRAQINEAVIMLFHTQELQKENFTFKNGAVYLRYEGRKKVWSHFVALLEVLKPQLNKEISILRRSIEYEENTFI
ncbi:MAG: CRISPR-associated endonuclease Cas1 [Arcobacteraceae bacterium]|jgi:CRISPR-associated protein Cas1|nr:CRISPR-associated endonuclease Cas1 [Arcobacteraceae bacterium]